MSLVDELAEEEIDRLSDRLMESGRRRYQEAVKRQAATSPSLTAPPPPSPALRRRDRRLRTVLGALAALQVADAATTLYAVGRIRDRGGRLAMEGNPLFLVHLTLGPGAYVVKLSTVYQLIREYWGARRERHARVAAYAFCGVTAAAVANNLLLILRSRRR